MAEKVRFEEALYILLEQYNEPDVQITFDELIKKSFTKKITSYDRKCKLTDYVISLCLKRGQFDTIMSLLQTKDYTQLNAIKELAIRYPAGLKTHLSRNIGFFVPYDYTQETFALADYVLNFLKNDNAAKVDWAVRFFSNCNNNCHTATQYVGWLQRNFVNDYQPFIPHLHQMVIDSNMHINGPAKTFLRLLL